MFFAGLQISFSNVSDYNFTMAERKKKVRVKRSIYNIFNANKKIKGQGNSR